MLEPYEILRRKWSNIYKRVLRKNPNKDVTEDEVIPPYAGFNQRERIELYMQYVCVYGTMSNSMWWDCTPPDIIEAVCEVITREELLGGAAQDGIAQRGLCPLALPGEAGLRIANGSPLLHAVSHDPVFVHILIKKAKEYHCLEEVLLTTDSLGITPLHRAVWYSPEVVTLILDAAHSIGKLNEVINAKSYTSDYYRFDHKTPLEMSSDGHCGRASLESVIY